MKRYFAIAALAIVAAGCGQNAPGDDANAATKGADKQAVEGGGIKPVEQIKGQEQVVNDPSQIKPGGSYRIEPANPNDEKYRPDPRLAGGG
jgi:PBP1b-binding outer membrane lipoprotein LpoB